ncbi:hypothetical protein SDC9_59161 [bioreactor metagenome]|uniref:Uncharacterized protein n=1 Tax=bioreactor metagenome TaxID=1076179 RepID=A0A644XA62_9ZZZZ
MSTNNKQEKITLPGRLSRLVPSGYAVDDLPAAVERLAAYEDLHEWLLAENERLAEELSEMRAAGLDRTARHRDLLGKKLQIVYALSFFNARGL